MEIILCIHNIRSTYNVGAILRTAEGLGLKKVICSGYTPWYEKPGLLPHLQHKLEKEIRKTALGAEKMLNISYIENLTEKLTRLKSENYQILGLENNLENTISLTDQNLRDHLKEKTVLILGEEVSGIPEDIRKSIELFLEIPMKGKKESFNVSVAAGITLFALTNL